jgi:GNAT superfamily N-acetyltransferase
VTVRLARADELPALTKLLVRAFADDPPMNWILQSGAARERSFETFFQVAVERLTFPFGEVYCDDELRGVALWTPPGKWRLRWYEQLRDLPAWGRAIGWSRLAFIANATAALTAAHPHAPHHYLLAIGVDTAHRGKGLARALIEPVLARCDAEHLPAYLEASRPALVPVYERFGFKVQQEVRLGTDGPPMFPMWRPAS